jgi:hypothetical protein
MMRMPILALILGATAQWSPAQNAARPSGFGGGFKSSSAPHAWSPPMPAIPPMPSISPPAAGLSGGFVQTGRTPRPPLHPGYPFYGIWPGYSGWAPIYPVVVPVEVPVPVPVIVNPPDPQVELSGQLPATLVLEFPAPAEMWVNGKKSEGEALSEWLLTSLPVDVGTEYMFSVRARWELNGKTFEYQRAIPVGAGNRTRSLVVSGKEIKE